MVAEIGSNSMEVGLARWRERYSGNERVALESGDAERYNAANHGPEVPMAVSWKMRSHNVAL